ncbi:hypothetical protein DWW84_07605 [Bifidobacterium pseudocatenulatum]|uniref:hypothetical protein n=1 Tax=Bifidobacterium pseudocatenulatum TaxID=28026 RepID=UPI000E54AE37|nr:hypothetical protein [Bifidobacterium pseudocatenulatum]RGU31633.1 hypothetical protein DWW84_07605 [Bifidobacterium pseudocatenulatum]
MTIATTPKYLLPYPLDNEPIRNLPDIIQSQAEGIESALSKFDFDGQDTNKLIARLAALETTIDSIRGNTVKLFNNDNQPFAGAITLAESAANFERLTLCFRTNDNVFASMDVINPNNKAVCLSTCTYVSPAGNYSKSRTYLISGKTINTYKRSESEGYWTGETNVAGSYNGKTGDFVTITQVIGTRKVSIL